MAIFFVILGMMLALPGLWLLSAGMWPAAVAKSSARTAGNLVKPFVAGLPVTIVAVVVASVLKKVAGGLGAVGASAVLCVFLVVANAGVAGLVTTIGQRLKSPVDAARPWRATLRGGIILELTYLIPVLGWFVILPASMIIGAGAVTMGLFNMSAERVESGDAESDAATTAPLSAS
jgi:hypothetical protein